MRSLIVAAAVSAPLLALANAPANAEMMNFKASLTGAAETPPTDSKGSGSLTATYDTATKTLTWSADYSGLTGPAIAAHFHGPAPAGKPAPVEVPQKGSLDSPMKGSATLTDAQAKDLMDGMMYFNIHTAANKPGEIRGQMEKAM
jgi:CHRD domain